MKRHIDATELNKIERPTLLITDAFNALQAQTLRKTQDAELIDLITATCERQGSILMPVEGTTRMLELAILLDAHWTYAHLEIPLIAISHTIIKTMEYANSMMDWTGQQLNQAFEHHGQRPFTFK